MIRQTQTGHPRTVFIDSSAFFAYISPRDASHSHAVAIFRRLRSRPVALVTTNFIVAETHALLLSKTGWRVAADFLCQTRSVSFNIERASPKDEERAAAIVLRFSDKQYSLVDAISFAVIDRLRIETAFAFDRNFSQYGVPLLRA